MHIDGIDEVQNLYLEIVDGKRLTLSAMKRRIKDRIRNNYNNEKRRKEILEQYNHGTKFTTPEDLNLLNEIEKLLTPEQFELFNNRAIKGHDWSTISSITGNPIATLHYRYGKVIDLLKEQYGLYPS